TGYGDIPTAVAAVKHGAFDYVAKPATADEIVDALMTPPGEAPPAPKNPIEPESARLLHIERVLHQEGQNVSQAARLLNMHRRTLQRILQRRRMVSHDAR
ncbi:MAG: helix-turn-helix domain-containing protein, partial [Pseudomonadota bacterium]